MTQAGVLRLNGHTWKRDAHVSAFAKENYGKPCADCGAPAYAHQINVIEHPTGCIRWREERP